VPFAALHSALHSWGIGIEVAADGISILESGSSVQGTGAFRNRTGSGIAIY
jgi:hypothetical protein